MSTPIRVLIVEDSEDDTLLVVQELRHGGYDPQYERVETAGSMQAALDQKAWDIIIADYTMPHFSGTEALDLLNQKGSDVPFIFVSGTIGEDVAVAAMKAGAHDYIMKGNLRRLVPAIGRELQEAKVRVERRKAEEALRIKTGQLEAVTSAMTAFLESGNWREASAMILRSAVCQTESEYGFIGVLVDGPALRVLSHNGITWDKSINREFYEDALNRYREAGYIEFKNLDNLFGRVVTDGQAIISNDPSKDPRSGGRLPQGHPPLYHFLGVPIFREAGVIGMIGVANRQGGYSDAEQSKIEILCQTAGVFYDSYRRNEKEIALKEAHRNDDEMIQHLAYYDILTGLPNRLLLHDSINRAITASRQTNSAFTLLALNLDRFSEINNTLGHHNGDQLLQRVGERLKDAMREADTVTRLGGDEFAILMPDTDAFSAAQAVNMIIKRLEEPIFLEGLSLEISASIGIALYPGHGGDANTIVRRADIAMHTAKKAESGFCFYSDKYDQYKPESLVLMGELRHAIEQDQLFLVYQPKIDLKTGRISGVEALVRWQHPKSGVIPPDQFISLAEKTGLIKHLTLWVLKEALRRSRNWYQSGFKAGIAVNLSMRNLQTPQLIDQIKGLLSTWGIGPSQLRLEITESAIMADPAHTMGVLTELTAMGICFSIDDFGTGYSSLGYLQKLPVDELKIDKSFVMNMMANENDAVIVRSVIELAHNLGIKVVAEGVESKEILDRLASLGCDAAQGYYISRPIPEDQFLQQIKANKETLLVKIRMEDKHSKTTKG